jgi:predicted O-linked N-acetylglucosamine transferase (SPINDLY family)
VAELVRDAGSRLMPSAATYAAAIEGALAHLRAGRLADVRAVCSDVLKTAPNHVDALHLLGVVAQAEGDLPTAIELISKSITINPRFAGAYASLGVVLGNNCQLAEAVRALRAALKLDPGLIDAHRHLLNCMLYLPDIDPEARLAAHLDFAARHQPAAERRLPPPDNDRDPDRRLRIGLLSSDFRAHPVARILLPVFRDRDRAANELLCYAELRAPDGYSEIIRANCDGWRSTVDLDDRAVAEMIRRDRIDVLVVLAGRFDNNRPLAACYRPAPVQISMFDGATTALREIDYWVTDPVLTPADSTERFTERLARLPMLFHYPALSRAPAVAALPAGRAGTVTFGSFNNPLKLSRAALELWARVLRAVPGARLALKYHGRLADPMLQARLRTTFGGHGVDPGRIEFLTAEDDEASHLAAYSMIDIALDTTPFSGATSSFDALWMGVPVVTLAGDTMISRMTASLLAPIGLDGLIADTPDAFVACAEALARDLGALATLRAQLRDRVRNSPLCDGPGYVRSLQALWRRLWQAWCAAPGDLGAAGDL